MYPLHELLRSLPFQKIVHQSRTGGVRGKIIHSFSQCTGRFHVEKCCSAYPYCYVVRPSKVYHILLDHFRLNRTQLVCCDVLYFNEIAALGSIRNFQWQLRNFKCRTPQSCSFGTLGNDVIVVDNNQGRRQRDASHCVQPKLGSEATGMPK